MNKSQFIETLAAHFADNKKAASEALDAVVDTIMREVARGEKVAITGFGAYEKKVRPSRMVRNPRTGERVRAKKSAVPRFRPGAEFTAVVSGSKKLPKAATATVASARKVAAGAATGAASTAKKTATTAKRTAAKATTTTKSSPAKSTASKSTAAKKSTTTKSSPAKKTAAKKTTATKSSPAKKTATKKSTAKRS